MTREHCHVETAGNGSPVRVQGTIDPALRDRLAEWARVYADSRCRAASSYVMPEIAQRLHKRETYTCGREKGHDGVHRWPDEADARWQWEASQ